MNDSDNKKMDNQFAEIAKGMEAERKRANRQAMIVLLFSIVLAVVYFFAIKWSMIQVFQIWDIFLTPNQSTAIAFLSVILLSTLNKKSNSKKG